MPADSHITTPDLGDIPFREWLRLSSVAYRVEESIRSANTAALSIAQDKTAASRNSSNHGLDVRLQRALHKTANVPRPRIGHPYYDSCKSIDSFHTLFYLITQRIDQKLPESGMPIWRLLIRGTSSYLAYPTPLTKSKKGSLPFRPMTWAYQGWNSTHPSPKYHSKDVYDGRHD